MKYIVMFWVKKWLIEQQIATYLFNERLNSIPYCMPPLQPRTVNVTTSQEAGLAKIDSLSLVLLGVLHLLR